MRYRVIVSSSSSFTLGHIHSLVVPPSVRPGKPLQWLVSSSSTSLYLSSSYSSSQHMNYTANQSIDPQGGKQTGQRMNEWTMLSGAAAALVCYFGGCCALVDRIIKMRSPSHSPTLSSMLHWTPNKRPQSASTSWTYIVKSRSVKLIFWEVNLSCVP